MKKMLYSLLLGTVLDVFPAQATQPGTTFYVVALTGAKLHEQPSFTSKLVRRLPLGGFVQAQQTITSHEGQRIGAGLSLSGDWVKVTTRAYTGYVFSADLTNRRPALKKSRSGMAYIDLLGPQKTSHWGKQSPASGIRNRSGEETST
jgi:hypothetical protein